MSVIIPNQYQQSMLTELEKLKIYGVIMENGFVDILDNLEVTILPKGLTYFDDKREAEKKGNKGLLSKLSDFLAKHGWFFGGLLGRL